jgi:hypothetical protein
MTTAARPSSAIIVFFVRVSGDVLTWVEERGRRAKVTSEIWMFII